MELFQRALRHRPGTIIGVTGAGLLGAQLAGLRAGEPADLLMAALAAGLAGLVAALLAEFVLRPVTTAEDVLEAAGQSPLVLPALREGQPPAEAFGPAVAELLDSGARRFQVSGPAPGSGKSRLAAALAAGAAARGLRTLLVDADFLRSEAHDYAAELAAAGGAVELQRLRWREELGQALAEPVPELGCQVFDHGPADAEELAALAAGGLLVAVVAPRAAGRQALREARSALAAAGRSCRWVLNLGAGPADSSAGYYRRRG